MARTHRLGVAAAVVAVAIGALAVLAGGGGAQVTSGEIVFVNATAGRRTVESINVDGSGRRVLARLPASSDEFTFSPDARSIAYTVDGRRLVVMNLRGGRARAIAGPGSEPAWSPDGKRLLYVSDRASRNPEIVAVRADGREVVRVAWTLPVRQASPVWGPTRGRVTFTRFIARGYGPHVWITNLDGTHPRKLAKVGTRQPGQLSWSPSWSPDGRFLAVGDTDREGLRIATVFRNGVSVLHLDVYGCFKFVWSPVGVRIAVITDPSGVRRQAPLLVLDRGGRMKFGSKLAGIEAVQTAAWAPDGRTLMFAGLTEGEADSSGTSPLYALDVEGSGVPTKLADGQVVAIAWRATSAAP